MGAWIAGLLPKLGIKALLIVATVLVVALYLLNLKRSAEKAGRLAERASQMEKTLEVQDRMLQAERNRPRSRDELAGELLDGTF